MGSRDTDGKGVTLAKEDAGGRTSEARGSPSSPFRGVCWNRKNARWQASVNDKGTYLYLGSFTDEVEAARAFDSKAAAIRGDKARLNFPEGHPFHHSRGRPGKAGPAQPPSTSSVASGSSSPVGDDGIQRDQGSSSMEYGDMPEMVKPGVYLVPDMTKKVADAEATKARDGATWTQATQPQGSWLSDTDTAQAVQATSLVPSLIMPTSRHGPPSLNRSDADLLPALDSEILTESGLQNDPAAAQPWQQQKQQQQQPSPTSQLQLPPALPHQQQYFHQQHCSPFMQAGVGDDFAQVLSCAQHSKAWLPATQPSQPLPPRCLQRYSLLSASAPGRLEPLQDNAGAAPSPPSSQLLGHAAVAAGSTGPESGTMPHGAQLAAAGSRCHCCQTLLVARHPSLPQVGEHMRLPCFDIGALAYPHSDFSPQLVATGPDLMIDGPVPGAVVLAPAPLVQTPAAVWPCTADGHIGSALHHGAVAQPQLSWAPVCQHGIYAATKTGEGQPAVPQPAQAWQPGLVSTLQQPQLPVSPQLPQQHQGQVGSSLAVLGQQPSSGHVLLPPTMSSAALGSDDWLLPADPETLAGLSSGGSCQPSGSSEMTVRHSSRGFPEWDGLL